MRKSLVSVIAVVCTTQLCPAMMPVNESGRHIRSIPPINGAPVASPASQAGTSASGDALLTREALADKSLSHRGLGSNEWLGGKAGLWVLDAGLSRAPRGNEEKRIAPGLPPSPIRPRRPVC